MKRLFKRSGVGVRRLRSNERSEKWRQLKAAINKSALSFRTGKAAFGSFATVATPV